MDILYKINDILVILSHTKIILILLHFFSITKYNSSKMQRIIFLFKYDETNMLLPIKAYVKNHPVQIMFSSFIFSIFYFSAIVIGNKDLIMMFFFITIYRIFFRLWYYL